MLGIVRIEPKPKPSPPLRRLWLVSFMDGDVHRWWWRFLRPGFRHVCAASYFADQDRWVYFDPTRHGTVIEVCRGAEFDSRFGELMRRSTAILRMSSEPRRVSAWQSRWCVGAIRDLLGIPCSPLTPYGLHQALLKRGAEAVELHSAEIIEMSAGQTNGR